MKATINLEEFINYNHVFEKSNLVTNSDGSDTYQCKKCGIKGKRFGISPMLQVSGKKSLIENCVQEPNNSIDVEPKSLPVHNDDVLEAAAELVQENTSDLNLSERDKVMMDLGSIKTFQFTESLNRFMKAQKLNKLLTNKKYKTLGLSNADEVFELCGIKPSLGKQLVRNIRVLTTEGYKALSSIDMKQKDINLLTKAKAHVETKGDKVIVSIAGERVNLRDKEELDAVLKKIEYENKTMKSKVEDIEKENKKMSEENDLLKNKLIEYTEPDKALTNAQNITKECQNVFTSIIIKLKKLLEKNNTEINNEVMATLLYMDQQFLTLKDQVQGNDEAEIMTPEDIVLEFGK